MSADIRFHELCGDELPPWMGALAHLRIRIFKEYPYLYQGSLEYERDYLQIYQEAAGSRVILVTHANGELLGASTCIPLSSGADEFKQPFLEHGIDVARVLYLGESIVLPEWRGIGLGKEFFHRRETHACSLGLDLTAFCAVDRAADHPSKPADYRSLDSFWQARGYRQQTRLKAFLRWQEIGGDEDTLNSLTFWTKSLAH